MPSDAAASASASASAPPPQQQSRPPTEGQSEKRGYFKPTAAEAVAAVRSLYVDELMPFGRILLKRIRERAAAAVAAAQGQPTPTPDADLVPLIDPKYLRRLCEKCSSLRVEPADGREYAVTLAGRVPNFVDACSPVDPYPEPFWLAAATYFDSLQGEDARLPGGRYACAQALAVRGLDFLAGRSLGELCHIVQLAISHKKILGYADGFLVPYSRSEECAKEWCAVRQQPAAQRPPGSLPFASWEELRVGLQEILETSCNPSPGMITMSNVKRLFRSQYQLELSETVLGHSRLCELLQDPRLTDICTVRALGNGQAVVQRHERPAAEAWPSYMGGLSGHGGCDTPTEPCDEYMGGHGMLLLGPSTCASNRHWALLALAAPAGAHLAAHEGSWPAMDEGPAGCGGSAGDSAYGDLETTDGATISSTFTCATPEYLGGPGELDMGHFGIGHQLEFGHFNVGPWPGPPMPLMLPESRTTRLAPRAAASWDEGEAAAAGAAARHDLHLQALLSPAFARHGVVVVRKTFIDVEPAASGARQRSQSLPRGIRFGEPERSLADDADHEYRTEVVTTAWGGECTHWPAEFGESGR